MIWGEEDKGNGREGRRKSGRGAKLKYEGRGHVCVWGGGGVHYRSGHVRIYTC